MILVWYQISSMLFESCQVIKVFLFDWWTCKHQTIWVVIAFASVWDTWHISLKKWPRFLRVTCNTRNFTFGCPTEDWSLDSTKYSGLKSCFKLDTSKIGPQNHLSHMRIAHTKKCRAWFFLLFMYTFASLVSVELHRIYMQINEQRNRTTIF